MSASNSSSDETSGCNSNVTWKKVDENSQYPARDGHCACSCHGKVFVFGGVVQNKGTGDYEETNDLLAFDTGKLF